MRLEIVSDPVPLKLDWDDVPRVGGTRVTLDTVIGAFNDGATPEEIVCQYSSLKLADVYAVVNYYLHHQADVEAYLQESERQAAEVRKQIEARSGIVDVRARLLARRAEAGYPDR